MDALHALASALPRSAFVAAHINFKSTAHIAIATALELRAKRESTFFDGEVRGVFGSMSKALRVRERARRDGTRGSGFAPRLCW